MFLIEETSDDVGNINNYPFSSFLNFLKEYASLLAKKYEENGVGQKPMSF